MANKHSGFYSIGDIVPDSDAVYVFGADALNWILSNFNNIVITNNSGGTTSGKFHIIDRTNSVKLLTITNLGNVGIATISPLARLHLPAGTATANTAPLKFTAGTNLGTTEAGVLEYDGTNLYFTATNGGTRYQLNQQTRYGIYNPTLTNVANLDASTAYECQYMCTGSTVSVSGRVDIDPTLTATSTQLGISLPIASNIGATEDVGGVAFASGIAGQGAAILGDAVNDRAQLQYISGDVTNQAMYFMFQYQIL